MTNIGDWKNLAIILPNSVTWWMVDGDGDDVVGWYDINYIYRRMTPRFVDWWSWSWENKTKFHFPLERYNMI